MRRRARLRRGSCLPCTSRESYQGDLGVGVDVGVGVGVGVDIDVDVDSGIDV